MNVYKMSMRVLKRGNRGYEPLHFDKIQDRLQNLCRDLPIIDIAKITIGVINNIHDGISTEELDRISARISESYKLIHPDYSILASRIMISNLHKTTPTSFSECMKTHRSIIRPAAYDFIMAHATEIDAAIRHDLDYQYDYFGYMNLEATYLWKDKTHLEIAGVKQYKDIDGKTVTGDVIVDTITVGDKTRTVYHRGGVGVDPVFRYEVHDRPQYMLMRVALEKHMRNGIDAVLESYSYCSELYYTNATPTLFNAITVCGQSLSCFLLGMADEIEDIMDTLKDASIISKNAGGIGIWGHYIRPKGSLIASTKGQACGLPHQLKMFNDAALCWDQGGKRLGAFAIYLEPWHGDIKEFLELKHNQGSDEFRARNLFYALWMPDLIMRRIKSDLPISLFNPDTAPGLADVYDGMDVCRLCNYCSNPNYEKYFGNTMHADSVTAVVGTANTTATTTATTCKHDFKKVNAFEQLYTKYENIGLALRRVGADEFCRWITFAQQESGTPYICFKDQANRLSNQSNIDTIRSSNLCVDPDTYILTDRGQFKIIDLVGEKVNVWNGQEFSRVTPVKTGTVSPMVNVKLSCGAVVRCTPYHKFILSNGSTVDAKSLLSGTKLVDYKLPVVNDTSTGSTSTTNTTNTTNTTDVPINAPAADKISWFMKYCDTHEYTKNDSIVVRGEYHTLLKIRLMLQTVGADSIVSDNTLTVPHESVNQLALVYWAPTKSMDNVYSGSTVVSVTDAGISDTYCFNEPKRHAGMFNGVLAGNCTEIYEVSTPNSYACCTLASINLKKFLVKTDAGWSYDHVRLHEIVRVITADLDLLIDSNNYPVEECVDNSKSLRPIGIGIQGLADVFCIMRVPYLSPEARQLRKDIHETIYHAAITESAHRAKTLGSYQGFEGSPASLGKLHPDLWAEQRSKPLPYSSRYNWEETKLQASRGLRNSLHIAPMPTASTAQVLGNNDSFEPFAANIGTKNNLAGKFTVSNNYMIRHLIELGLWSESVSKQITNSQGSILGVPGIPAEIKEIYRTVWEIPQSELIKEAGVVSAFIDQGMSFNVHLTNNSHESLRRLMICSWEEGLKTGSYYIRTRAGSSAMKNNTVELAATAVTTAEPQVCRMEAGCVSCSS